MAQKHVVEVVIDHEQFLGQLLIGDAWNELQDPLLHGAARAVEFLQGGARCHMQDKAAPHEQESVLEKGLHGITEQLLELHKPVFKITAQVLQCNCSLEL